MSQEEVTFNVMSDPYATFISTLRCRLPGPNPEMVKERRPVLAKQTGDDKPPPKWIHVELKGCKDGAAPKVAIRSDNVYIFAFTNIEGKWFKLTKDNRTKVLPDAEPLGFVGNYHALIGGVGMLSTLNLGKYSTSNAAATLWKHYKKPYVEAEAPDRDPDRDLKRALATLCVVLCEAARFAPVSEDISRGWNKQAGVHIPTGDVDYIANWGKLSKALLGWKGDDYKNDEKWFNIKDLAWIHTGDEALNVVELVLNIPPRLGLLAWLKHLWGVLVKKPEQEEKNYDGQVGEVPETQVLSHR